MQSVQQAPQELIGVILMGPLEHIVDFADSFLQGSRAVYIFLPLVLTDLCFVPH